MRPAPPPTRPSADDPQVALSRGVAEYQAGRWAEAVAAFEEALRLRPDWPSAMANLGAALRRTGEVERAAEVLERASELAPANADAWNNLGNLRRDQGRREDAAACFRKAVAIRPDLTVAFDNLADVLADTNEAIEARRSRLAVTPNDPVAWINFGRALSAKGHHRAAVGAARESLALKDTPEAWAVIGLAQHELGRFGPAVEALEAALERGSKDRRVRLQRIQALVSLGRSHEGLAYLDQIRAEGLEPAEPDWEAQVVETRAAFLAGEWDRAWERYECRWKFEIINQLKFDAPPWAGQDLTGKRVALWAEQGAGDVLQFVRFAPALADRGAHVVLVAAPELTGWLKDAPGVAEIAADNKVQVDYEVALLSAPRWLGVTPENAGGDLVPYLSVPKDRAPPPPLATASGLKVGIAWRGSALHPNDKRRSADLSTFLELAGVPGVRLFSLQIGDVATELKAMQAEPVITDLSPWLRDWRDTAAALRELDLVVSIDTSVIHAAGALGVPAFVLLAQDCDWRWLHGRDDTPWYPTHRLFRQDQGGDWSGPIARARKAMAELARGG